MSRMLENHLLFRITRAPLALNGGGGKLEKNVSQFTIDGEIFSWLSCSFPSIEDYSIVDSLRWLFSRSSARCQKIYAAIQVTLKQKHSLRKSEIELKICNVKCLPEFLRVTRMSKQTRFSLCLHWTLNFSVWQCEFHFIRLTTLWLMNDSIPNSEFLYSLWEMAN